MSHENSRINGKRMKKSVLLDQTECTSETKILWITTAIYTLKYTAKTVTATEKSDCPYAARTYH